MAKEQLAVIEMVTNMILGKTEGISKVDFVPQGVRNRKMECICMIKYR